MLLRHSSEKHGVAPLFTKNVTGVFHSDAMIRQLIESVKISQVKEDELQLINIKAERNCFPISRTVITRMEIRRCNFVIYVKPYARLHEIIMHSNLLEI